MMRAPLNGHRLSGRHALVTGAGRGIGRSIALALAEVGADVALSARTTGEIEAVARQIENLGCRGLAVTCDVTKPDDVQRMAEEVTGAFGGVDILVNNAGQAGSHKIQNHPDELWHGLLAVNLHSVYYVTKAFASGMIEQKRGRIINIASTASKVGSKYMVAYTASKHGVLGFTRALAMDLVGYNITVNAICPSYVDTPMTEGTIRNITGFTGMSAEQAQKYLEGLNPQNRLIQPEEVAAVALFLASDLAHGITGQAINVDGGAVQF